MTKTVLTPWLYSHLRTLAFLQHIFILDYLPFASSSSLSGLIHHFLDITLCPYKLSLIMTPQIIHLASIVIFFNTYRFRR
jgi:hypothetical protein